MQQATGSVSTPITTRLAVEFHNVNPMGQKLFAVRPDIPHDDAHNFVSIQLDAAMALLRRLQEECGRTEDFGDIADVLYATDGILESAKAVLDSLS